MRTTLFLATGLLLLAACSDSEVSASTDGIERVEPPFWWQGLKNTELQLLIHGDDLSELSPTIDYPGVSVDRVETGDSPNYLFIYLDIDSSANAGTFEIVLSDDNRSISHGYELRARDSDAATVQGFSSADAI